LVSPNKWFSSTRSVVNLFLRLDAHIQVQGNMTVFIANVMDAL
jgi:hypothetical protein